jgi:hypothetical protein
MRKHADLDCRTEGLTPSSRRGSIATAAIVGVVTLLSAGATPSGNAEPRPKAALEEIYILRSIREPHEPVASWCAPSKTGFEPFPKDAERFFSFWSLRSGPDGRVVHTKQARAAELRACFGATSEPARQNFYAEIKLGSISFRGDGECLALRIDFPDAGLFPVAWHGQAPLGAQACLVPHVWCRVRHGLRSKFHEHLVIEPGNDGRAGADFGRWRLA